MNEWGLALQRNTPHFKMAALRKLNDQNESLNIENYQIWAPDVDTCWGKLLFEINIVEQTRFLLRVMFVCFVSRKTRHCVRSDIQLKSLGRVKNRQNMNTEF